MTDKVEESTENQTQQQAESGPPEEKSGVRANIFAGDTGPAYEVGEKVSATSRRSGVSRRITAKVLESRKDSRQKYEYSLGPPAESGHWYQETELDFA